MKKSSAISNPAHEPALEPYASMASAMTREGLRLTPQRRHVYEVLMGKRDHPTATEVFIRAQKRMPSISLATVYNCLETMVGNGLVKAVHVDREPTRFCANPREHGHFHCTECGLTTDIESSQVPGAEGWKLPTGFLVTQHDVTLRGLCRLCAGCATSSPQAKSSQPKDSQQSKTKPATDHPPL